MNIETTLSNAFQVKKLTENSYQISTPALMKTVLINAEQKKIVLFIDKTDKGYILSDKQITIKNLSREYALNAQDIKMSIKGIAQANDIKIAGAMLFALIENENALLTKVFDMITCIGQLYRMYVFFEMP